MRPRRPDKGKPESPARAQRRRVQQAEKNAAKKCKAERKNNAASFAAFKTKYGKRRRTPSASASPPKVKKAEASGGEVEDAKENAAKKCKKERATHSAPEFKTKYGHERQQGERLRQVRLQAREGASTVVS